jgi:hypothetical protein
MGESYEKSYGLKGESWSPHQTALESPSPPMVNPLKPIRQMLGVGTVSSAERRELDQAKLWLNGIGATGS